MLCEACGYHRLYQLGNDCMSLPLVSTLGNVTLLCGVVGMQRDQVSKTSIVYTQNYILTL